MADGETPYIVEDRRMLSRVKGGGIKITHTIEPGERTSGCLTCCYAPDGCPMLACLPCVDLPEYIVNAMKASRYIYVRENSLEWNNPWMQPAKGRCCGHSCCHRVVMDDITVMHFDDVHFDDVRNDTRPCNESLTFCCGGNVSLLP
mmetsp:Transcript_22428/g.66489  ORF Transcript_22428/g.66489 Transcript_22428/m.66489 type:complete len:146 (-) Transcript_22428:623-1060(-)